MSLKNKSSNPDHKYNTKFDLVIANGTVLDPKTETCKKANIGIRNGKIEAITEKNIDGNKEIDAHNKIVSPGFIDFFSHVDGNPYSAECIARQGGTTTIGGGREFDGLIIRKIAEEGFFINQGFFFSHSFTLRTAAGINSLYRPATEKEIRTMMHLAESFLEHGAFGIHFGLEFFPGTSQEEIISLSKVCKKYDRVALMHLRKDGREGLSYFDEIIQASEITGVSIQVLHLMYMFGMNGALGEALKIIDDAKQRGIDITADSGIYDAFSTSIGTAVFDNGWEQGYGGHSYHDLLISSGIYTGQRCDKALFHYLRKEFPHTLVTAFVCDSHDIPKVLLKPYIFVSTHAADGPHYPGIGHPESSGTFPKLIGHYVREKKIITLMEAIKKITILPAERFRIKNKGWIGLGADADIVVFDFNTIIDKANYPGSGLPDAPPDGIEYVIVNGEVIIENNFVYKNKKPGKLLKCT